MRKTDREWIAGAPSEAESDDFSTEVFLTCTTTEINAICQNEILRGDFFGKQERYYL